MSASIKSVKTGTIVHTDGGFDCMPNATKTVESDKHGLYVECARGKHYLDGQIEGRKYIGISLPPR